ncbi:unnamed protein product [Medioppia subpectinata]|uniref:Alanine--glyoxylate aminotransferase n=1 Tax=Medioppia subpectinata TaxID=1979941 RepID=A0A7R9KFE0_9ACAR|nr:unnamed protein product [Medioppia subpectinata]CAG2102546.1 unnamed protein product [Medioppia subpectinata]
MTPKPKSLLTKLDVPTKYLFSAGITNMSTRVKAAMILPLLSQSDPQFQQILKDITEGIRYIFQTSNRHSFAISGPNCLAFETAISNLTETDDKILLMEHGADGERMAKSSKTLTRKLIRLQVANPGDLVDTEPIKQALTAHQPKVLFLRHGDTSAGTLQPLRGIGALCRKNNCIFMVDASATVCCAPLSMDKLEIDVLIAGTQFALGLSPGLTLMSFNDRAVKAISQRKCRISHTMNFDLLAQSWGLTGDEKVVYHYTPSISLLYALRESLAEVVDEGLDKMIERHMKFSLVAQKEISKIGLKFLVEEESKRLTSVLVIQVPDSIKRDAIIEYLYKYYNVIISSGIPPIDKVWRIGILGQNANRSPVKLLITVLRESIQLAKKSEGESSLRSPSTISSTIE